MKKHNIQLDPYQHDHIGVEEIPWSRLGKLFLRLVEKINADYRPDIVVGIAKGGVIPAAYISSVMSLDFFPIKLSSRYNEKIVREIPKWYVLPTKDLYNKKILLVDDISVAGRTIQMAKNEIFNQGAIEVRTATIAVHNNSVTPDYYILKTDALIIWPWDRDMLSPEGKWVINPEYLNEMNKIDNYTPGSSPASEQEGKWV